MVGPNNANASTAAVGEVADAMKSCASTKTINGDGCSGACIGLAFNIPILVDVFASLGFIYHKETETMIACLTLQILSKLRFPNCISFCAL